MISVITPVYNGENFIESCLKVAIDQACPEVEHIIVDGGSTDGTIEIIQQYADKYPHIRWISEKDKGQSDAMNKGIAMAKGKIVAFLNVDDYYEPNVLNRVSEIFKTLPEPSLLVGNCNVWNDKGILYINKPKKLKFADLLLGHDANPFPLNPSAYFYHTSLHQKIGLYDTNEHYAMDIDFLLRAVQVAEVKYVDEIWGNFRFFEGTKTFEDIRSGRSGGRRVDSLIKAYQKDLPLSQRCLIAFGYEFYKAIDWPRFKYFLDEPGNIPKVTNKKIRQFFGVAQ